jgi:undecaprenyl-diphosphatase
MKQLIKRTLKKLRRLDYNLFWLINGRMHAPFVDVPVRLVNRADTALGDPGKIVILLLLAGVWAWYFKRPQFSEYFLAASGIILVNGLIGLIIKRVVRERRPLFVFGSSVRVLSERRYIYSMPSGHTLIAFCVATLLSSQHPAYAWLFYFAAALVGIYRVYVGSHFPSDTIAGALLGITITNLCLK